MRLKLSLMTIMCCSLYTINVMGQKKLNIKFDEVKLAKEVYGTHTIYQSKSHLSQYREWLSRVEVLDYSNVDLPENSEPLTNFMLLEKYNGVQLDSGNNVVINKFNPLKYRLDFNSNTIKYYYIQNTNFIIKVNPISKK